jgi:hypothetical protein
MVGTRGLEPRSLQLVSIQVSIQKVFNWSADKGTRLRLPPYSQKNKSGIGRFIDR